MKKLIKHIKEEWYKYLLEILVLIIGIYGAFALENWNQNRLAIKQEKLTYQNIIEDLHSDSIHLVIKSAELKKQIALIDQMIIEISGQSDLTFQEDMDMLRWGVRYDPITRENHLNSSDKISNQAIRRQLLNYFRLEKDAEKSHHVYVSVVVDKVRPFLASKGIHNLESVWNSDFGEKSTTYLNTQKLIELYSNETFGQLLFELRLKSNEILYKIGLLMEANHTLKESLDPLKSS